MQFFGAVYQINNDPINNHVLIYGIRSDGSLEFVTSVSTGGRGTSLNQTDPLYSQDPVVVFQGFLFVVNAGNNSITMFKIDSNDPTKITRLTMINSNGDYPVSIAVNPQYIAVLNGGTRSGFQVYSWNPNDPNGIIKPIPGWYRQIPLNPPQSTPPMGPPNTVSQIMFSKNNMDDTALIVAYKGSSDMKPGAILTYPIQNGMLSNRPIRDIPEYGYLPFSMVPIDNNNLLVVDASSGVFVFPGLLDSSMLLPITGAVCWSTYSSKTGNYYVIGAVSGNVSEITIDPRTLQPSLVKTYPLGAEAAPSDTQIATINNMDYLYVNSPRAQRVDIFRLNGPGQAEQLESVMIPSDLGRMSLVGLATISMTKSGGRGGSLMEQCINCYPGYYLMKTIDEMNKRLMSIIGWK